VIPKFFASAQDRFGYDLNALAQGMSEHGKLRLIDKHHSAWRLGQILRAGILVVAILAALAVAVMTVFLIVTGHTPPPWFNFSWLVRLLR
jgi:hypothetical protein